MHSHSHLHNEITIYDKEHLNLKRLLEADNKKHVKGLKRQQ